MIHLHRRYVILSIKISNPALGVNDISKEMNVSRATVFNKIKSTLNTTPNMLIHILRLEKAAQLLRNPNVRISEVYYTIGFTSGSYFSKLFRKEFGMTPKEYTKLK
jgi:AraC-like DNA-binding protein